MRILFILNGGIETASARERVLRYLPELERQGIQSEVHVAGNVTPGLPGRLRYWFWLSRALVRCEGIFIHRVTLSRSERILIRAMNRPVVFDVDDAIWYRPEPRPDGTAKPSSRRLDMISTLRLCRFVRAGNGELARFVESTGVPVRLAPTCVPSSGMISPPHTGPPAIGWIGHSANFRHLEICSSALRRLVQERPEVRIRVVADRPPGLHRLPIDFVPWSLATESGQLNSFSIGIMPLADTPWTRGKCGYKLLLYMSHGLPVVASPVGVNSELVRHGVDGYLARTEEEWLSSLRDLVDNPDRRAEMGRSGRGSIEGKFDQTAGLQALLRDIHDATASRYTSRY